MIPRFQTPQARRRFLAINAAMLLAIFVNSECSGKHGSSEIRNDEGEPASVAAPMVSTLKMSDPSASVQLAKGFYGLEGGAWRWAQGAFEVVLKTPPGAAQKGATLTLSLVVQDTILKQVRSQTLTAAIGATTLKSEKYTDPGNHSFTADVPAALLSADTLTVDFSLDKPLPPGPADRRELGVIVTAVALETN
jgi:hypothetical protein